MFEQASKYKEFISIDVETTGLDPKVSSILQVGAVKFTHSGEMLQSLDRLFRPDGDYIPKEATEIHGITMDMVKGCHTYSNNRFGVSAVKNFCNGFPLVGHNIRAFDLQFLNFKQVRTPYIFDTMEMARKIYGGGRISLKALCEKCEVPVEHLHNALCDARLSMLCFLKMIAPSNQLSFLKEEPVVEKKKETIPIHVPVVIGVVNSVPVVDAPKDIPSIINGDIYIPFTCDEKYHWWVSGAMQVPEILKSLQVA
jgi:DNA polymerase III epsilon subunit family exonuclease